MQIKKLLNQNLYLILIVLAGAFFRLYGLNWDQGLSLHPDERAIVMAIIPMEIPSNIAEFLNPASTLNPHFFAYGNFPMYLLKIISLLVSSLTNYDFNSYGKINIVGRLLSVFADIGTIIIIFLISKKILGKITGIFASFFYATAVFPIQASHFFAVDILLTFFIMFTIYRLILFYEKPTLKNAALVGFFFGISLSTKISAIPLIIAIIFAITADFLLILIKQPHKPKAWFPHLPIFLKRLIIEGFLILFMAAITFITTQPYALIDFQEFIKQNFLQFQMTHNPFIFPYTLQYVGKIPYLYEIKNIFLWGLGPILASISFTGFAYSIFYLARKGKRETVSKEIILLIFFLAYFLVTGRFAVGWMRYMLPLYPSLCIFAAVFVYEVLKHIRAKFGFWYLSAVTIIIGSILIWPLSFINIYNKPNTRILASLWINQNISPGKTLAIEHWDDSLPLFGQEKYKILTLELYNSDTPFKWQIINEQLSQTDYIIIASNRLYTPLQKLIDCSKLTPDHCYPLTANYYKNLFDEKLNFKKVAEFSAYPTIPILNISIDDQSADESFTVYDHPKIMIFKKEKLY